MPRHILWRDVDGTGRQRDFFIRTEVNNESLIWQKFLRSAIESVKYFYPAPREGKPHQPAR
ncbi:hypothetical protein [Methanosarcina barkeri]|uniref:hypothetical protein n=1 Tax=Methanosarcina barkeri TaxID=2208 RepID=UPI00003C66C1|nr:hypothetical protein [Methanosarcina barkeri]